MRKKKRILSSFDFAADIKSNEKHARINLPEKRRREKKREKKRERNVIKEHKSRLELCIAIKRKTNRKMKGGNWHRFLAKQLGFCSSHYCSSRKKLVNLQFPFFDRLSSFRVIIPPPPKKKLAPRNLFQPAPYTKLSQVGKERPHLESF